MHVTKQIAQSDKSHTLKDRTAMNTPETGTQKTIESP